MNRTSILLRLAPFVLSSILVNACAARRPAAVSAPVERPYALFKFSDLDTTYTEQALEEPLFVIEEKNPSGALRKGFINAKGEIVILPRYLDARDFHEGLAAVAFADDWTSGPIGPSKRTGPWGFINSRGEVVIEPAYATANDFSEGLAAVGMRGDDWWGHDYYYINHRGARLLHVGTCGIAGDFHDGVAAMGNVHEGYSYTESYAWYITARGDLLNCGELFYAADFVDGLGYIETSVTVDSGYGWGPPLRKFTGYYLVDAQGRRLNELTLAVPPIFSEGLAFTVSRDRVGYIDRTGRFAFGFPRNPGSYYWWIGNRESADLGPDEIHILRTYRPFSEGLAKVGVNGRCAYVDKTGKIVVELPAVECKATDDLIPPKDPDNYLSMMNLELVGAVDFHDGRAFYNPPDTPCVYLIDRQGRVVTDTPFTDARSFAEGRAFVRIRDKWALIDTEGRVITGPAFDYLEKYVSLTSLTSLRTLPLFYYYDRYRKGDGFYRFRDGLAKVQIDGKLAYVDREGRIVWRQGG